MSRYDYSFMTVWELQQEMEAIKGELDRRVSVGGVEMVVSVDPAMPPDVMEIHSAGKIYRFKLGN